MLYRQWHKYIIVCLVVRCLFFIVLCVVSSTYVFWLPLWYLQSLLTRIVYYICLQYDVIQVWVHNTSLAPPLLCVVPLLCHESEWSCICVLGVSLWTLSIIFLYRFGLFQLFFYWVMELFRQWCFFYLYVFTIWCNVNNKTSIKKIN